MNKIPGSLFVLWLALLVMVSGCGSRLADSNRIEVKSTSMVPTLQPGDRLEWVPVRTDTSLKRYQIVVFIPPFNKDALFAFRVISLPGEKIELSSDGIVINDKKISETELPMPLRNRSILPNAKTNTVVWNLKNDEIFVLGDNLENANDSRSWGALPISNVVGIATGVVNASGFRKESFFPETNEK